MLSKIKKCISLCNPFNTSEVFKDIIITLEEIKKDVKSVDRKIKNDILELQIEAKFYKSLSELISETIPDMIWLKDLDGKYMFANTKIKENLLFDNNPLGKTDIELSLNAKKKFGAKNHTFGEVCGNSDFVVIEKVSNGTFTTDSGRFLESGLIKGKMMYLEVFKAPFYVDGKLIGVAGVGRDMTVYVEAFRENNCFDCGKMQDIFKIYEYKG